MIFGFSAVTGAGFGAGARIDGQAGFGGDAAMAAGFSSALAQAVPGAATPPAPVGEGGTKESDSAPETASAEVDAVAAETVTPDAAAPVTAAAMDAPANAAVPLPTAEQAAAMPPGEFRRGNTTPDLAAAVARATVAPTATAWQANQRAGADNNAAATVAANAGGTFVLPETLRPQLPTPAMRTVEMPPLPVAATEQSLALPTPAAARAGLPVVPEWSPVKVDAGQAHWGRELMAALAERVEMQVTQQIKQARIRLDPPELGRLQLTVRFDNDRLSVQLNASQPQLREVLAQQLDRLRTDLVGQYGERVDVSVGQEQRQQRQPGGEAGEQPWPGIAAGLDMGEGAEQGLEAAPRWQGWVNALA